MTEWKVYATSDSDWMLARTPEEALSAHAEYLGYESVEAMRSDEIDHGVFELQDADLDSHRYAEEDDDGKVIRSFRHELERRIATGEPRPELFASTEY